MTALICVALAESKVCDVYPVFQDFSYEALGRYHMSSTETSSLVLKKLFGSICLSALPLNGMIHSPETNNIFFASVKVTATVTNA